MDTPRSTPSPTSPCRWIWPVGVQQPGAGPHLASRDADPTRDRQIVNYTLPERLIGPEPADCEVVLGDDYGARVLERVLQQGSWWLWWTEKEVLARLERRATGIRRVRHLPDSLPEVAVGDAPRAVASGWIARRIFGASGSALLPPGSPLQAVVLDAGASRYSEMEPNFWIGVPPLTRCSPRALEDWCAAAIPVSLSLEPFARGAECVCMIHDGDISIRMPEVEATAMLDAIGQWASAHGVCLELQAAAEGP